MNTSVATVLLDGMFDDASYFPPAAAPLEAVLGLHAASGASAWSLARGRLLLPLGVLDRLASERALLARTEPLDIGIVVGSPADPTAGSPLPEVADTVARLHDADPAVHVRHVEYRPTDQTPSGIASAAADLTSLADELDLADVFLEVASTDQDGIRALVDAVTDAHERDVRVAAKLRFGGLTDDLRPSDGVVVAFLDAVVTHRLPFKGTAGLHHAWYASEDHHGYLAVALAVAELQAGRGPAPALDALRRADATDVHLTPLGALVAGAVTLDAAGIAAVRRSFVSFGTCSFTEPLAAFLALPGAPTTP